MSAEVFVYTMAAGKGRWSRYGFPFAIDAFAQLGNHLYLRSGDAIYRVDPTVSADAGVPFPGRVQWPWLDLGQPGVTKMLESIDVVATGSPSISLGTDQRNTSAFTAAYEIPADTLPGTPIPFPVSAPSLSARVDFAADGSPWSLTAVNLLVHDDRAGG